jgi:hypothetical protein
MRRFRSVLILVFAAFSVPLAARAHCPLCTAGAGALALLAAQFGVSAMAIGVFIGAFALALGLWAAKAFPAWRIPYRRTVLGVGSFLLTVWPLRVLLYEQGSTYISLAGDYGSFLNRTYVYDRFLVGTIIGALLLLVAPKLSTWMTSVRKGKMLPFQGMTISLVLLLAAAVAIELIV